MLRLTGLGSSLSQRMVKIQSPCPEGFNWHVAMQWGDELFDNSVPFNEETRGDAASQALAFGDNNDGMELFSNQGRSIFVVNNEYVNRGIIFGNRESGLPETDDDVKKGMMGHGVTVCEISQTDGKWSIVKGSEFNRPHHARYQKWKLPALPLVMIC